MKNDLRYSPSDCFETFPFPEAAHLGPEGACEKVGARLYEARARLMVERTAELQEEFKRRPAKKKKDEAEAEPELPQYGLTKLYNDLKDPECDDPRIVALRGLHLELDRAVWAAYGWPNVEVPAYTTPRDEAERRALEAFEDEVIDRLFELNAQRAAAEAAAKPPPPPAPTRGKRAKAAKGSGEGQGSLL